MAQVKLNIPEINLGNKSTPILVALLIIAAFLIGTLFTKVSYLEKGESTLGTSGSAPAQPTQPNQPAAPAPGQKVDVKEGTLPLLGNKDAKVTIVEFSDLQCPFCKRFFDDALVQIKKEYIDTGKVKFAFRHYPLTQIHPNANKASSAVECANEQGKFWEYHDLLFKNQDSWASLDNASAVTKFKEYAGTLGLNGGQFNSCLDSDKYKANIDKDLADGSTAGVNGTPSTFVNGQNVVGAQPFSNFKTLIDAELAK